MPIRHQFVSTIPDDPEASAAGQVVPSNWNDDHTAPDIDDVTGLQDALDGLVPYTGATADVDLGTSFPTNTDRTDRYLTRIYCAPNGTSIDYYIKNIVTGAEASGTVSSNLPAQSTLLSPQIWMNNGTTASAVSIHVVTWTIEVQF